MSELTTFKPYIFNAYYQWFIANGITPHLVVNTLAENVYVPTDYILPDHSIVLSIAPGAVKNFHVGSSAISFEATFGGHLEEILIPFAAMEQLIAKEQQMAIPIGAALQALEMGDADDDEEDGANNAGEVEFIEEDDAQEGNDPTLKSDKDDNDAGFEFVTDDDDRK